VEFDMNPDSEKNNNNFTEKTDEGASPDDISVAPIQKKKRPWWFYLLICLGSLLLLGLIAIIAIFSYYRSLINNYTELKPRPLPPIVADKDHVQTLFMRWTNYVADVLDRHSTEQFVITEEDINQMIANFMKERNFVRVVLTNGYIRALLSVPLENSKRKELKGRYLNADVDLKLRLEDGFLTLRVERAMANGKPAPSWILKKISQKNLLENMENNYDFLLLLQAMDSVQVKDGGIVFTPLKEEK
jgi:hypothetical protein